MRMRWWRWNVVWQCSWASPSDCAPIVVPCSNLVTLSKESAETSNAQVDYCICNTISLSKIHDQSSGIAKKYSSPVCVDARFGKAFAMLQRVVQSWSVECDWVVNETRFRTPSLIIEALRAREENTTPAQPQYLFQTLQQHKGQQEGQSSSDKRKSHAQPPPRCARQCLAGVRPDLSPQAG